MKSRQIELVQRTFAEVARDPAMAAEYFYSELFRAAPETRALFEEDLGAQRAALIEGLKAAVEGLEDPQQLYAVVEEIGRQQAGRGVRPDHYKVVGTALIWSLEQGLGDGFTDETREAWMTFCGILSGVMAAAAADAQMGAQTARRRMSS